VPAPRRRPAIPVSAPADFGPIAETNLRRALMTDPEWTAFFTRPLSALLLLLALLSVALTVRAHMKGKSQVLGPA
jgi:putative tricarboxylic transport membrane protein